MSIVRMFHCLVMGDKESVRGFSRSNYNRPTKPTCLEERLTEIKEQVIRPEDLFLWLRAGTGVNGQIGS